MTQSCDFCWTGMEHVRKRVEDIAPYNVSVLLTGESGTGKTQISKRIHELSSRSSAAWIRVNCPAIPSDLFESAVFGHVKGAFTGAVNESGGYVAEAEGGTLFLDEVGDLAPHHQAKLLAFLDERSYRRVGSTEEKRANVRLICATHRRIDGPPEATRFEAAFLQRISEFVIDVPALRERLEAIGPIAGVLIEELCAVLHLSERPAIEPSAVKRLQSLDLRGNIRELRRILLDILVVTKGKRAIAATDLPAHAPGRVDTSSLGVKRPTRAQRADVDEMLLAIGEALPRFNDDEVCSPDERAIVFEMAAILMAPLQDAIARDCTGGVLAARKTIVEGLTVPESFPLRRHLAYAVAMAIRWDISQNLALTDPADLSTNDRGKLYAGSFGKGKAALPGSSIYAQLNALIFQR